MEQELKDLLIKDLCARLPYNPKVKRPVYGYIFDYMSAIDIDAGTLTCMYNGYTDRVEKFIPYLRPMSSMTEEEIKEFSVLGVGIHLFKGPLIPSYDTLDWLNKHHFDYRGLIEKGLALEAPNGMYK